LKLAPSLPTVNLNVKTLTNLPALIRCPVVTLEW